VLPKGAFPGLIVDALRGLKLRASFTRRPQEGPGSLES